MSKMELSAKREGYGCSSCAFFFFLLSAKWNEITQAVKYKVTVVIGLFITSIHPFFFITTTLALREAGGANPSCLGVKAEQVASLLQGHMQKKQPFTLALTPTANSEFPLCMFLDFWEKAVGPGAIAATWTQEEHEHLTLKAWGSNPWPLCVLRGNSAQHCDTVSPFITYETKYRICMKRE